MLFAIWEDSAQAKHANADQQYRYSVDKGLNIEFLNCCGFLDKQRVQLRYYPDSFSLSLRPLWHEHSYTPEGIHKNKGSLRSRHTYYTVALHTIRTTGGPIWGTAA